MFCRLFPYIHVEGASQGLSKMPSAPSLRFTCNKNSHSPMLSNFLESWHFSTPAFQYPKFQDPKFSTVTSQYPNISLPILRIAIPKEISVTSCQFSRTSKPICLWGRFQHRRRTPRATILLHFPSCRNTFLVAATLS